MYLGKADVLWENGPISHPLFGLNMVMVDACEIHSSEEGIWNIDSILPLILLVDRNEPFIDWEANRFFVHGRYCSSISRYEKVYDESKLPNTSYKLIFILSFEEMKILLKVALKSCGPSNFKNVSELLAISFKLLPVILGFGSKVETHTTVAHCKRKALA